MNETISLWRLGISWSKKSSERVVLLYIKEIELDLR